MFSYLRYRLFKLKLIKLSESDVFKLTKNSEVDKLEYALKHGSFKTRIRAAEALGEVGDESSIPLLINAINDNVQLVSLAALNALEELGSEDEVLRVIINKRFNWVKLERENRESRQANAGKKSNIYRWERASKKSFDRVKEQLKKPMR